MPFKKPLNSPLTESQNKALSKLNSLNTYVTAPKIQFPNLKKSQQISTFDLSTKFLDAISGPGTTEAVMNQFLRKVFATYGENEFLLEDIIIKGLAKSLDVRQINLAPQAKDVTNSDLSNTNSDVQELTNVVEYEYSEFQIDGARYANVYSNIPDRLPTVKVTKFSADTQVTVDEFIKKVKTEFNNVGYYSEEFDINYPPTGTLKAEVPYIYGDVSGKVKSLSEDKSLSGVKIEIVGANPPLELLSDESGNYLIKNLKIGTYVVKASLDGYKEVLNSIEINKNKNIENILNFELEIDSSFSGNSQSYSTGATNSNSSGNTENLVYSYSLVAEPLTYDFKKQKIPANATRAEDITSLILTVTNNKDLPTASITIGPIDGDEFVDYQSLDDKYYEWVSDFSDSNELVVDGITYPGNTDSNYVFLVTNNAGLPSYEYVDSGTSLDSLENYLEVFERFTDSLNEERVISGTTYPPQGAEFVLTQSNVGSSKFIPNQDSTDSNNTSNQTVGVIESDIEIDENLLITSLSSVTGDFRNQIINTFSFRVNPDDVGLTNEQYLTKYLRPSLSMGKRALVAQIIKMIFGPKEKINPDPEVQEKLLNAAACGEKMYSISNNPGVTEQELEYNRVELKRQLEAGKIELIVSCQKVEISLPENFEDEFDLVSSEDLGIPESQRPNPAESFTLLNNYVKSEMQRQRNEEDSTQVKQSFFQIVIEKIMQYISVSLSVSPEMNQVFGVINAELIKTGQEPLSSKEILSSPCEICESCKSGNEKDFEQKSAFSKSIINSLYSIVLSMLIRRLISEAKSKIAKLIQEKAKEKILKLIKRQKEQFDFLKKIQNVSEKVSKATEYKERLNSSGIKDIFNFRKEDNQ
jgi:hypothetical protein